MYGCASQFFTPPFNSQISSMRKSGFPSKCPLILLAIFSDTKLFRISLGLISSGALGNAIDRVYFGGVIDFIDFFIYNFHWPAFNFADIFITIGVILLLFDNIFNKKNEI